MTQFYPNLEGTFRCTLNILRHAWLRVSFFVTKNQTLTLNKTFSGRDSVKLIRV